MIRSVASRRRASGSREFRLRSASSSNITKRAIAYLVQDPATRLEFGLVSEGLRVSRDPCAQERPARGRIDADAGGVLTTHNTFLTDGDSEA